MADSPPPSYAEMRLLMAAAYDACRRHRVPIGLAPNIEVSLVVNPDDAAFLAPRTVDFYVYEAWRRTLRVAAKPLFRHRMGTAGRRASGSRVVGRDTDPQMQPRIDPIVPGGPR